MQSLRITLYEVFGYLAPGLIGVAALAIGIWSCYLPTVPLTADVIKLRPVLFFLIAFIAYILGHFLQAVGNLHARAEKRKRLCRDCHSLQAVAVEALKTKYQITIVCENLADVTALAFAIMSQTGKTDAYEVFVYREGFYRAGYLSFAMLAVSFLLRALHPASMTVRGFTFGVPMSLIVVCFLFCTACSVFFFLRFRRFGEYRVKHVLGVISISPSPPLKDSEVLKD
jgi:hypothetical protein